MSALALRMMSKDRFIQAMMAEGKTILGQLGPDNPLCGLPQYAAMLQEIVEIGPSKTLALFNSPQAVAEQSQWPSSRSSRCRKP